MGLNGMYARLYSLQFRDSDEELAGLLAKLGKNHLEEKKPVESQAGVLGLIRSPILRKTD